jgi:hypothetical protein
MMLGLVLPIVIEIMATGVKVFEQEQEYEDD